MQIVKTISEMVEIATIKKKQGVTVGFVPTMGYLHEGHISLVNKAKSDNDLVVMSIFVNPLQFGVNEDLDKYPRDFERDEKIARAAKVDFIFYPDVAQMYPNELASSIHVLKGIDVLCGKSRPGHFDGVATVVLKLFNIVQPTRAYFGMKDAQQVAVIENMVADFNIPVKIVKCKTLREEDGLAKSSRNVYLSKQERQQATELYNSLIMAQESIQNGERNAAKIKEEIISHLSTKTSGTIDYVEALAYPSLEKRDLLQGQIIIAVALKFNNARLIDNLTLTI